MKRYIAHISYVKNSKIKSEDIISVQQNRTYIWVSESLPVPRGLNEK